MIDPLTAIALAKVALDVLDKVLHLQILDVEATPANVRAAKATARWEDEQRWRAVFAPIFAHFPLPAPVTPPKITQAGATKTRKRKPGKVSYEPVCPER